MHVPLSNNQILCQDSTNIGPQNLGHKDFMRRGQCNIKMLKVHLAISPTHAFVAIYHLQGLNGSFMLSSHRVYMPEAKFLLPH